MDFKILKKYNLHRKIILFIIVLFLVSCNTENNKVDSNKELSKLSLKDAIQEYSRTDKHLISLFHGSIRVEAIFLTPKLIKRFQKELDDKELKESSLNFPIDNFNSSIFLVAFYTPNDSINDLSKVNSLWNIILKSDGQKYEAKEKSLLSRKNIIFKHFFIEDQKFSRFYIIKFPKIKDSKNIKLLFTSMDIQLCTKWNFD